MKNILLAATLFALAATGAQAAGDHATTDTVAKTEVTKSTTIETPVGEPSAVANATTHVETKKEHTSTHEKHEKHEKHDKKSEEAK